MEIQPKKRLVSLVLGEQAVKKIESSRVLVVGAGGIGCELVKNLSKSGYKTMTILDFDSIEITNLNRQFYFRKDHIGLSKAETVKNVLLSMNSSLKITSINASIYESKFNLQFYEQFDLIFSCLDNMKAREHLAAQATKYNKPLIDAGTMSYNGQTYASIRFLNSCHNCNPSHSEQPYAFCTIRSHPQLPVHCATYAKNFYESFFGLNHAEALSDQLKFNRYFPQARSEASKEELSTIADKLFQEMFNISINDVDLQGNKIQMVRKLTTNQAVIMIQVATNPQKSTFVELQHNNQLRSPYMQEKLWSIADYYTKFKESIINLLNRKLKNEAPASFEKDDQDCMTLILSITNLRTYNFINFDSQHNKHKYLTFYQCKDLIGKVFPAIASTNAIAAALEARQAVNVLTNSLDKLRYISFGNRGDERISPSFQGSPNFQCNFCSQKIIYDKVSCNMSKTTFKEMQQFAAQNYFTRNRDVSCGAISIIRNSRSNSLANRDKPLNSFPEMVSYGILQLKFTPQLLQPQYQVYLNIIHCEQQEGIVRKDGSSRRKTYQQLLRYFRKSRSEFVSNHKYELQLNGGPEL